MNWPALCARPPRGQSVLGEKGTCVHTLLPLLSSQAGHGLPLHLQLARESGLSCTHGAPSGGSLESSWMGRVPPVQG